MCVCVHIYSSHGYTVKITKLSDKLSAVIVLDTQSLCLIYVFDSITDCVVLVMCC